MTQENQPTPRQCLDEMKGHLTKPCMSLADIVMEAPIALCGGIHGYCDAMDIPMPPEWNAATVYSPMAAVAAYAGIRAPSIVQARGSEKDRAYAESHPAQSRAIAAATGAIVIPIITAAGYGLGYAVGFATKHLT